MFGGGGRFFRTRYIATHYYWSIDTISPHNYGRRTRRAFSVAGPAAWNCLSDELREPLLGLTANSFRQLLLRLVRLLSTNAYSALEVLHIMHYIKLLTYFI